MRNIIAVFTLLLLASTIICMGQEDMFDSQFDGVWSGFMHTDNNFAFGNFPFVLVLNASDSDGSGMALTLVDPASSLTNWAFHHIEAIKIKKNKIEFVIHYLTEKSANALTISFKLRYSKKANSIRGKYSSDKDAFGSGSISFYHSALDAPFSGFWSGNKPGDLNALLLLYNSRGEKGRGLAGETFGNIVDIVSGLKTIQGRVADSNFPYTFALKFAGKNLVLSGTFNDIVTGNYQLNLFPAGTKGVKPKIRKITPSKVEITNPTSLVNSQLIEFKLKGKNLCEGTILFSDNSGLIPFQTSTTAKLIIGTLTVDQTIPDGTKINIYALNPDNQISNAKSVTIIVKSDGGGGVLPISLANDIQPVFDSNCIGCHGSSGGLSLRSPSYNSIVGIASSTGFEYIKAETPDVSYIIMKLEGDSRISGSPMPIGGSLSSADIAKIRKWVEQGANNN